jgi:hypothetical protein
LTRTGTDSTLENPNITSDSDPGFFGIPKSSPLLVTTNFFKNARVTIWVLSVKIREKLAKFVLKNGIVSLVSLFAIFQLAPENIFDIIKYKINFSQTISKYPFRVTRVTISNNGDN